MRASTVGNDVTWVDVDTSLHIIVQVHVLGALANDFLVVRSTRAVGGRKNRAEKLNKKSQAGDRLDSTHLVKV
jgi:hypothetical protein